MCIVFSMAIFVQGLRCEAGEIKWFGTLKEGLASARKSKKWVFVEISADWCGPCRYMEKNVLSKPKTQKFLSRNFVNVKLNADEPSVKELLNRHNARGIPCIMIFEPSGKMKSMNVGALMTEDSFIKTVSGMVKN